MTLMQTIGLSGTHAPHNVVMQWTCFVSRSSSEFEFVFGRIVPSPIQ